MLYTIKLKTILKSKYIYLLLIICLIYSFIYTKNNYIRSKYSIDSTNIKGTIKDIKYKDKYIEIYLDDLIINYYGKEEFIIGDIIYVEGIFSIPNENGNFNLFNYKKYLYSKKIHYIVKIKNIKKIGYSNNILYSIKKNIYNKINNSGSKEYLNLFILGNNNYIENNILESYRNNGISHLFSISGMHISIFTSVLLYILNKIFKNKKIIFIILLIFLVFYLFLTNFSISIIRASSLFLISLFFKIIGKKIETKNILIILFSLSLIDNPYNIYNTGFLFSYFISYSLIIFSKQINNYKKYYSKLFITSIISFLISIPILINNYFNINLITPLINLIFVPLVSIIIFPLSILTFIFPFLEGLFNLLIYIMENISLFINKINYFNISLCHMSLLSIIIYYLIIYIVLINFFSKNYKYILVLFIVIFIHHNINIFNSNYIISFINVGQGDTILITYPHNKNNILIDCYNTSNNTIISYLKSQGINKINTLIITHGDNDHIDESINLINNFRVEKVIFNCGEFNDLENNLIKVLNMKKISYYSCIEKLDNLYFLQTKIYDNENNNSNVIYIEINGYKFIFMGDAEDEKERDILDKYNIRNVDVLKVGHHGSKTSSSELFINEINPKYSIISVGKNNRYGHPSKEVLNRLNGSKIYRTDRDGSIMFKIKNNKLEIETCSP